MSHARLHQLFKILTILVFASWTVATIIVAVATRLSSDCSLSRGLETSTERLPAGSNGFSLEPSERRAYCGVPTREAACPIKRHTFAVQQPTPQTIYEQLGQRLSLILLVGGVNPTIRVERQQWAARSWELIQERAEILRAYWARSQKTPHSRDFQPAQFEVPLSYQPELVWSLNLVSREVISTAHTILTQFSDPELVETAAALWWAARSFQVQVACPDSRTKPTDSTLISWLEHQGALQTCRREYLNRAVSRVQRSLENQGADRFRLDSPEWRLIQSLGSRRERAQLFLAVFPSLSERIREPNGISRREVYTLGHLLLQVSYELMHGKVLTWNGLQPAGQQDLELLEEEAARLQQALVLALISGRSSQNENPLLYQATRRTWSAVFSARPLDSWVRAGLRDRDQNLSGVQNLDEWELDCNQGLSPSCDTWVQLMVVELKGRTSSEDSARHWRHFFMGSAANGDPRNLGVHEGVRAQDLLRLLPVYRDHLTQGLADRRTAPTWRRLHTDLTGHFRRALRQSLSVLPPGRADFTRCLSFQEWQRWITSEVPISRPQSLRLEPQCAPQLQEAVRASAFQILVLDHIQSRNENELFWSDNVAAVVARYAIWHAEFILSSQQRGWVGQAETELANHWTRAVDEFRYSRPNASDTTLAFMAGEPHQPPWLLDTPGPQPQSQAVSEATRAIRNPESLNQLFNSSYARFY